MRRSVLVAAVLVAMVDAGGNAAPLQWSANGHYYEFVTDTSSSHINWEVANAGAAARSYLGLTGYLATLTSEAENDWVFTNVLNGSDISAWFGGLKDNSATDWRWVTGEAWSYTKWYPGQPDYAEAPPYPDFGLYYRGNGYWGDAGDAWPDRPNSYVVEYSAVVPEPVSAVLGVLGLISIAGYGKQRRR